MTESQTHAAELALSKLEDGGAPQIILDHISANLHRIKVDYDFSDLNELEILNNKIDAILSIGQTIEALGNAEQTAALNTALLLLRSKY